MKVGIMTIAMDTAPTGHALRTTTVWLQKQTKRVTIVTESYKKEEQQSKLGLSVYKILRVSYQKEDEFCYIEYFNYSFDFKKTIK